MGRLTQYEGMMSAQSSQLSMKVSWMDVCMAQSTEYEGMDICTVQLTQYQGMDVCTVDSVQRQCLSALQTCSYAHHKTDNVRCTRFQSTDNDVMDVSIIGQFKHLTR